MRRRKWELKYIRKTQRFKYAYISWTNFNWSNWHSVFQYSCVTYHRHDTVQPWDILSDLYFLFFTPFCSLVISPLYVGSYKRLSGMLYLIVSMRHWAWNVINTTNSLLLLVSQNTCNKQDLTFVSFSLFRLQASGTTACLKVYPLSLFRGKLLKIT